MTVDLNKAGLPTHLFVVQIPVIDTIGFFSQCSGLELSFAMLLRRGEHQRGGHTDITRFGGWRAYRRTL